MITLEQYFIGREHSNQHTASAVELLASVNQLLAHYALEEGIELPINPHTGTLISGVTEGGFRLPIVRREHYIAHIRKLKRWTCTILMTI